MSWKQIIKLNSREIFFIFAVFFLMVLISCASIGGIVRQQLSKGTENALRVAEGEMKEGLSEVETILDHLAFIVQQMLERDADQKEILEYLSHTTNWVRQHEDKLLGFYGIYGIYGFIRGELINSIDFAPAAGFVPQNRPWYEAAVRNTGKSVVYSEPYRDDRTGDMILSATRNLYAPSGELEGFLVIDISLSWFRECIRSFKASDDVYSMIVNQYMVVMGHPKDEYLGRYLRDLGSGYKDLADTLRVKQTIPPTQMRDTDNSSVIVSFQKMRMLQGWYVGVVTPVHSYYQDVYSAAFALTLVGIVSMLSLSYILLRLSEARLRSDEENKTKSAFLAMMSHEIRTPLNAIIGLSEIQFQRDLPEETLSDLEKIYNSGSVLLGIINDILDISKIEAGGFEIVPTIYDTPSFINDTVQLNIVRVGSKPIEFFLDVDSTLPAKLCGDELRVKQILNNLLSNAFKYTQKGTVTFRIGWRRELDNAALTFVISDTGAGVKREDLGKLFQKYRQLDTKSNRRLEGTGLGLSITKNLVTMMGGTIYVESKYGTGSAFQVHLSQKIVDDTPIGAAIAEDLKNFKHVEKRRNRASNISREYMPYGRVLVVDDVVTNLDVARGLMLPYGLTIECASSGWEAIEKIKAAGDGRREKYDVVFMDHMMPEMDGIEATRVIRGEIGTEYARTVPIVGLTANALSGNEEIFLKNGFDAFITKPVDIIKLDRVLNTWVRDRQSQETLQKAKKEALEKLKKQNAGQTPARGALEGRSVEGVSLEDGVTRYGGEANYLGVLRSYVAHTPDLLEKLRGFSGDGLPEYAVTVHGLKGSSYGIGAETVGKRAEILEAAAKAGDADKIKVQNEEFIQIAERLLADLGELLRASEDLIHKKTAPAPDEGLLREILDAARSFKASQMEKSLAELERYEYETGGDLIPWLRERLDNLEYDAIRERLTRGADGN